MQSTLTEQLEILRWANLTNPDEMARVQSAIQELRLSHEGDQKAQFVIDQVDPFSWYNTASQLLYDRLFSGNVAGAQQVIDFIEENRP